MEGFGFLLGLLHFMRALGLGFPGGYVGFGCSGLLGLGVRGIGLKL